MFKGFELKKVKCPVLVWDDGDGFYTELFPDICSKEEIHSTNELFGFTPIGRIMEVERFIEIN